VYARLTGLEVDDMQQQILVNETNFSKSFQHSKDKKVSYKERASGNELC
jgi:hypothetical protein